MQPGTDLSHQLDAACRHALAVLLEVGTELALECKANPNPTFAERVRSPLSERAKSFEIVASVIRRTVLLRHHIQTARITPAIHPVETPRSAQPVRSVGGSVAASNRALIAERVERLERLERSERLDVLGDKPPIALIQDLSADLGITPPIAPIAAHPTKITPPPAGKPLAPEDDAWVKVPPPSRRPPPH